MDVTLDADHGDELFDKMKNMINEAILRFTEDGLEVTTADPAMVSMIHLEVPESSFEEYEVELDEEEYEHLMEEDEEGLLIGVDLENLATVIGIFDEEINLSLDENQLVLTEGSDRFELPILNLSTDDSPDMDSLDFKMKAEIENTQFKTLRKKLSIATDSCKMSLDEEGELTVEGGGDQISVETSFQLEDAEVIEEDEDAGAESMFALSYLKDAERMFDNLDTCDSLEMGMGDDFPMKLTHESNRENLVFVLAPRIEEQ